MLWMDFVPALFVAILLGAPEFPSSVALEIGIEPSTRVDLSEDNATTVSIPGSFTVTSVTGPDQFLGLSARLRLEGGSWPASVTPDTIEDVQEGGSYLFEVEVVVPADAADGEVQVFILTVILENLRAEYDETAQFSIEIARERKKDDGGRSIIPIDSKDIPWGLFIFLAGLLILAFVAAIWTIKNIEIVREIGGGRRIMLREKKSGRLLKRRRPPGQ